MIRIIACLLAFAFLLADPSHRASSQWSRTPGPGGGDVVVLANDGYTLYAGTYLHDAYASTDLGATWRPLNIGASYVTCFAFGSQQVFAGTYNNGLFVSADDGQTWRRTSFPDRNVRDMIILGSTCIVSALGSGIGISDNGGDTWTVSSAGLGTTDVGVLDTIGTTLFLETWNDVFRSTDKGRSWTNVSNGVGGSGNHVFDLAASGTSLFALTWEGVHRSQDLGAHWSLVLPAEVARLARWGSKICACGRSLWTSSDGGDHWDETPIPPGTVRVESLGACGSTLFVGTWDSGILATTGDGAWTHRNRGFSASTVKAMLASRGRVFASTGIGGLSWSSNEGETWMPVALDTHDREAWALAAQGSSLYAGTADGILSSTDGGDHWSLAHGSLAPPYPTAWTHISAIAPNGASLFAATDGGGVFRSTDGGGSWTAVNDGLTDKRVATLLVDHGSLFAATAVGVFRSMNGAAWSKVFSKGATAIVSDGTALFASNTFDGVYRSSDGGATWATANTGLTNMKIGSLSAVGSSLFALPWFYCDDPEGTIFLSTNGGAQWQAIDDGLPVGAANECDRLKVSSVVGNGSRLFAGTMGGGVWRRPVSDVIAGISDPGTLRIPREFSLEVFPNPFNPTTRIRYSVGVVDPSAGQSGGLASSSSPIRLAVFDLLGREVAVLVNENKEPASYDVVFDGTGLSTGVYVCRLTHAGTIHTRKLLLLR